MSHKKVNKVRYSSAAYDTMARKVMSNDCFSALCGKHMRRSFMICIGGDPFEVTEIKSTWCHKLLTFCKHLLGLIPYVGVLIAFIFELCFKSAEDVAEIIQFCEDMEIPEDMFPSTHEEIALVCGLTTKQLQTRLRPSPTGIPITVAWTAAQRVEMINRIKEQEKQILGFNLIRLLGIGSKPHKVKIPTCYQCGVGCGFGCNVSFPGIYGGSTGMATSTVNAIIEAGISFDEVKYALDNYERLWRDLVMDLFCEAKRQAAMHQKGGKLVVQPVAFKDRCSNNNSISDGVSAIAMTDRSFPDKNSSAEDDIEAGFSCIDVATTVIVSPLQELMVEESLPQEQ